MINRLKKLVKQKKKKFLLPLYITQLPIECRKNSFSFKTETSEILFLFVVENASFPITLQICGLVSIHFAHKGLFRVFNDNPFRGTESTFLYITVGGCSCAPKLQNI